MFLFTDEGRNTGRLDAYNYKLYKSIMGKMQKKMVLGTENDSEQCMLYCKFREVCIMLGFKDCKVHPPETYGMTEAQVKHFLLTDRYITANLLLKILAWEKNQAINKSRKKIVSEFNVKMEKLKLFTKGGQKKFDSESR